MSQRLTLTERRKMQNQYLNERMACTWSETLPMVCTRCQRKYKAVSWSRRSHRCKARRRPNRWGIHFRRSVQAIEYPRERITFNATYLLGLLREAESKVKHAKLDADDLRSWKYHPDVIRHRRLVRRWWAMPSTDTSKALYGDRPIISFGESDTGWITRGRKKLIKRALAEKRRVLTDDGCTYTFYPNAETVRDDGRRMPLFAEEAA